MKKRAYEKKNMEDDLLSRYLSIQQNINFSQKLSKYEKIDF